MSIIELIERRANRAHAEAHGLTLIEDLSPAEQKAIHDDMEAKARYVRTAAGVRRFKRPIGAIILPRGLGSLDRIRIKDPVFKGFDLVEDRKGNLYDVGKDDSTGKYVALKHNTWDDQIKPADSLDDALAALNEKLGGGTNSDREEGEKPAPKAKTPEPKKAPERTKQESADIQRRLKGAQDALDKFEKIKNDPYAQSSDYSEYDRSGKPRFAINGDFEQADMWLRNRDLLDKFTPEEREQAEKLRQRMRDAAAEIEKDPSIMKASKSRAKERAEALPDVTDEQIAEARKQYRAVRSLSDAQMRSFLMLNEEGRKGYIDAFRQHRDPARAHQAGIFSQRQSRGQDTTKGGTMGGQGSPERDAFIESHPKIKEVLDYDKPKLRDMSEKNFRAYVAAVEGGKSPNSIGAIMDRVAPGASWNPTTEKWSGQNSKGRPTSPTPTGDTSASDAADAAVRKRVQKMKDEERSKGRTNPYTSSLAPYQRDQVNALTPGEYAKYMNARDAGETHRSAHSTAKGEAVPSKPKTREAELEESREIMKMHETANYARRPFVRAENDFTGTANMIDNGKLKTKRQAENAIKNLEKNIAKREAMMADKTRLDELLARDVEARQRHLRDDKARLEKVRAKVSAMPADREPAPYVPDPQKPESAPKQSHMGTFGVPITDQRGVAREIASITENAKNASRIRTESTARKRIKVIDKSIEVLKKLQDDKDSPMTARQRRDADTAIKYVQDVKDGLAKRFGDSAPKGTGRFAPKETPSTPSRTYDERPGDPGDASFRRGASKLRQAGIEDFQPNDARRLDDMTASEQSAAIDRLKAGESIADVLPGTTERQMTTAEKRIHDDTIKAHDKAQTAARNLSQGPDVEANLRRYTAARDGLDRAIREHETIRKTGYGTSPETERRYADSRSLRDTLDARLKGFREQRAQEQADLKREQEAERQRQRAEQEATDRRLTEERTARYRDNVAAVDEAEAARKKYSGNHDSHQGRMYPGIRGHARGEIQRAQDLNKKGESLQPVLEEMANIRRGAEAIMASDSYWVGQRQRDEAADAIDLLDKAMPYIEKLERERRDADDYVPTAGDRAEEEALRQTSERTLREEREARIRADVEDAERREAEVRSRPIVSGGKYDRDALIRALVDDQEIPAVFGPDRPAAQRDFQSTVRTFKPTKEERMEAAVGNSARLANKVKAYDKSAQLLRDLYNVYDPDLQPGSSVGDDPIPDTPARARRSQSASSPAYERGARLMDPANLRQREDGKWNVMPGALPSDLSSMSDEDLKWLDNGGMTDDYKQTFIFDISDVTRITAEQKRRRDAAQAVEEERASRAASAEIQRQNGNVTWSTDLTAMQKGRLDKHLAKEYRYEDGIHTAREEYGKTTGKRITAGEHFLVYEDGSSIKVPKMVYEAAQFPDAPRASRGAPTPRGGSIDHRRDNTRAQRTADSILHEVQIGRFEEDKNVSFGRGRSAEAVRGDFVRGSRSRLDSAQDALRKIRPENLTPAERDERSKTLGDMEKARRVLDRVEAGDDRSTLRREVLKDESGNLPFREVFQDVGGAIGQAQSVEDLDKAERALNDLAKRPDANPALIDTARAILDQKRQEMTPASNDRQRETVDASKDNLLDEYAAIAKKLSRTRKPETLRKQIAEAEQAFDRLINAHRDNPSYQAHLRENSPIPDQKRRLASIEGRSAGQSAPRPSRVSNRPQERTVEQQAPSGRDYREVAKEREERAAYDIWNGLPTRLPEGQRYGDQVTDWSTLNTMSTDELPSVPELNRAIRTLEAVESTEADEVAKNLTEVREWLKERLDQDRAEFEAANTSLFGDDFNIPERPVVAPLSMRRAEAPSSAPQGRVLNMRAINEDTAKVSAARRAHQRATTAQERARALQGAPATLASLDSHVSTLYEAVNSPRLTDAQRERVQSQITSVETARRDLRDMIDDFEMERSRSQANGVRVMSTDDDMAKAREHLEAIRATQDYRTALSEMRRLRALERRLQTFTEDNSAGVSHVQIAEAQSLLTRIATIRAESNSRFAADIARAQSARV